MPEIETIEMTKLMLAESLNCTGDEAYLLIRFGEALGWVKPCGNMPVPGGRGRGLTIYAVPANLGNLLQKLWADRKPTKDEG